MAKASKGPHTPSSVQLSYQQIRTTTSPDEAATGVKSFVINLPVFEILKLDTKENLRSYIAEYNPRKRNRVHEAIETTIRHEPQRFITRNSGFVIAASDIDVDDNKKTARLTDASILNGAQSQGEIKRWIVDEYGEDADFSKEEPPFFVRAEIIVDTDPDEVVETAIARNTATPVKSISQAGARGHLDDLEASLKSRRPDIKIRKSETDTEGYDPRKILQYARLLMPLSVSGNDTPAEKLRPYKNPEQCLTEFSDWFERGKKKKDEGKDFDADALRKYQFTVNIAPYALEENEYWEKHDAWNGQRVWEETKKGGRACRRDKNKRIIWVSPGIIFPIIGAMSQFVQEESPCEWRVVKPRIFKPGEMIASAIAQFRSDTVNSDPMLMGRSSGVYDALRIYPRTLVEVMSDMKAGGK
jgi:hypothetical protein